MKALFLFLSLLPLTASAEPAWEKLDADAQWKLLEKVARTKPMNWGEGSNGIDYGGKVPGLEGDEPPRDPRPPAKQDAAAPSSGYRLGVSVHRRHVFLDELHGKVPRVATRADIEKIHNHAGSYEYGLVEAWMKKHGEKLYDQALRRNSASIADVLKYAQARPGAWVGLKSKSIHHAVQAFDVAGTLVLVDPNVPAPMIGQMSRNGFEWSTPDGKLHCEVDFIYLPAVTWK